MNLVACRWTFSIKERCFPVYGDHKLLAYSRFGFTRAQSNIFMILLSRRSLQTLLIRPSILLPLVTATTICFDHDILLYTLKPRSDIYGTHSSRWPSRLYDGCRIELFFLELLMKSGLNKFIPQSNLQLCNLMALTQRNSPIRSRFWWKLSWMETALWAPW